MMKTAQQEGIVAFYREEDATIRVFDMVYDYKVENIKTGKCRWYSTHGAYTAAADIQSAISNFLGYRVLQRDIDYLQTLMEVPL